MTLRALFGRDTCSRRTPGRTLVPVFFKLLLRPWPEAHIAAGRIGSRGSHLWKNPLSAGAPNPLFPESKETSATHTSPKDGAAEKNGAAAPAKADQSLSSSTPIAPRLAGRRGRPDACRHRAPVRMGASCSRPWRPAVHRPARPLGRPNSWSIRFTRLQGRRAGSRGMGGPRRRRGGPRTPETLKRSSRRAEVHPRDRDPRRALEGRRAAVAGVRPAGLSRGHPAQVPLPRFAPRHAPPQHRGACHQLFPRSGGA